MSASRRPLGHLEDAHPRLRTLAIRNYAALLSALGWLCACVCLESAVVLRAALIYAALAAYLTFMYGAASSSKPRRDSTRCAQSMITTMYATWGVLGLMSISGTTFGRDSPVPKVLMVVVVLCLLGLPLPNDVDNSVAADVGRTARETVSVTGVALLVSACLETMA